ncbi:peptidase S8/S53 domain-containing protein [Aspergillus arachidicola]|uniref:Peptidase S8/S53 domain-containing protein n=1 Tax=Aspergillus arachidicola TaxID=656916 RepID=A0A5N6Y075_9EURO|nr:peptidase S8/S53 domain-containing protein [Aspergillus arachidicola]
MTPGLAQVTIYGVQYSGAGIIDALHEMANPSHGQPLPYQITTSYYFFCDKNVYDALARFAAQGQALFVASGYYGSYNETTGSGAFPPADHPLVTSVGGTELVTSGPGGDWVSETTWSSSGGDYSPRKSDPPFTIPWWQAGMDYTASKGSTTVRNAPDVSMVADSIMVFSNGNWTGFAGTSAAAPLWAGFMALANEQAAMSGRSCVGFANPALWEIGRGGNYHNCFHDITTGNNFNSANPNLYNAVTGYDLCIGWGSPKGQNLIEALIRAQQTEHRTDCSLCLAPSQDGQLEFFAIGGDGSLWHIWQTAVNNGWSVWFSHGGPPGHTFAGSTVPPVVASQADSRLHLFVPSFSGDMWRISQTVVNNGWSDWVSYSRPRGSAFLGPAAIAMNANSRLELFIPAQLGVWHIWQTAINGDWSDWSSELPDMPNEPVPVDGSPALGPSADGCLEMFVLGFDNAVWYIWQTAVNNGWSAPVSHGKPRNGQLQPNR